jgi:phosphoenolpyruvate synthase/pyruvate phosphate dikinase
VFSTTTARWLVEQGIESSSLNPDTILKMTTVILDTKGALHREQAVSN